MGVLWLFRKPMQSTLLALSEPFLTEHKCSRQQEQERESVRCEINFYNTSVIATIYPQGQNPNDLATLEIPYL